MAGNTFKWSTLDEAIDYLDTMYKNIQTPKDLNKYKSKLYFFINHQHSEIAKLHAQKYNVSVKNITFDKYQVMILDTEKLKGLDITYLTNLQIFKLQQYSNYLLKDKSSNNSFISRNKYLCIYLIIFLLVILIVSK